VSVVKEEYSALVPQGNSLADIVVLSQAWKKSHAFIRRHNWYADVLELDVSTVDLEHQLKRWGADIAQEAFLPHQLHLVPAPKNAKWEFKPPPVEQVTAGIEGPSVVARVGRRAASRSAKLGKASFCEPSD